MNSSQSADRTPGFDDRGRLVDPAKFDANTALRPGESLKIRAHIEGEKAPVGEFGQVDTSSSLSGKKHTVTVALPGQGESYSVTIILKCDKSELQQRLDRFFGNQGETIHKIVQFGRELGAGTTSGFGSPSTGFGSGKKKLREIDISVNKDGGHSFELLGEKKMGIVRAYNGFASTSYLQNGGFLGYLDPSTRSKVDDIAEYTRQTAAMASHSPELYHAMYHTYGVAYNLLQLLQNPEADNQGEQIAHAVQAEDVTGRGARAQSLTMDPRALSQDTVGSPDPHRPPSDRPLTPNRSPPVSTPGSIRAAQTHSQAHVYDYPDRDTPSSTASRRLKSFSAPASTPRPVVQPGPRSQSVKRHETNDVDPLYDNLGVIDSEDDDDQSTR